MHDAPAVEPPNEGRHPLSHSVIRAGLPSLLEAALAVASALLLILAFPDFDFWWLAWIGLAPLLFAVTKTRKTLTAFFLGMLWGTLFFYGTCWWLTYPMIHYGHISAWLAYPLLLLPVLFVSMFPGLACAAVVRAISRFGDAAIFVAPVIWVSFDWLRYVVTGQVWNALGYSQAYHPFFIQPASWGGVYAISFLLVTANTAITFALVRQTVLAACVSLAAIAITVVCLLTAFHQIEPEWSSKDSPPTFVVAVQPNVPMESGDDAAMRALLTRHLEQSRQGLASSGQYDGTRLVIWPESPMNFRYSRDLQLQSVVSAFARTNHTSLLLNSLEPAANEGGYNSAILVNEEGRIAAQYDKIRLMPFGEYVPLPRWLPGSGSVRSIVGEFTPGSSYTLMPLGAFRVGVFICIEAVHPAIARSFTNAGADVLVNISNDGYLGPTPVMRQHLANAIFRAVENNRDLIRVTNTGTSAYITKDGRVQDATPGFQPTVRTWGVSKSIGSTFYSRHGDVFVYACALITLGIVSATFMTRRRGTNAAGVLPA
ncbi:MAG TPA: apolipoprotein N-acyltransferase [Pyrinomonadaceae bacterium]